MKTNRSRKLKKSRFSTIKFTGRYKGDNNRREYMDYLEKQLKRATAAEILEENADHTTREDYERIRQEAIREAEKKIKHTRKKSVLKSVKKLFSRR